MRESKFKSTLVGRILLRIYNLYCLVMFIGTFMCNLPLFFLADILNKPKFGLIINHYWANVYFFLIGIPMEITTSGKLSKDDNYILCANHFSYLDVAILPFFPLPFKYIGKISIAKVPLFGYMFKKFHITVDRSTNRERYASFKESTKALNEGFNIAVFPEGGIKSAVPPKMHKFKEGAFRMAVETDTKIVPITLVDNWHIFPTDDKFYFNRRKCRIVIHDPIDPSNYSLDTLKQFQQDVYDLIQNELDRQNKLSLNS